MLESYIRNKLEKKDILLMTHIVLGYPSFDDSMRIIEAMVTADVDLIELQIPFSEPTADGPVIVRANQGALKGGVTVKDCFKFVEKVARAVDIPFLIMSYYNILFKFGLKNFVTAMSNVRSPGRHHTRSTAGRGTGVPGCHVCGSTCSHTHLFTHDIHGSHAIPLLFCEGICLLRFKKRGHR